MFCKISAHWILSFGLSLTVGFVAPQAMGSDRLASEDVPVVMDTTQCPDNHVPGCFFDKQTLPSASGEFSYARHSGLFLTGALTQEQLALLQEQGVVAVIDIRQANEDRSVLQAAATSLGMVYQNTPLFENGTKTISLDAVQAITAFHKTYKKTPHVVACSSGNRSSAWFGAHQHLDHGLDTDASVSAAREAFLRDDMADELRRFIGAQGIITGF